MMFTNGLKGTLMLCASVAITQEEEDRPAMRT